MPSSSTRTHWHFYSKQKTCFILEKNRQQQNYREFSHLESLYNNEKVEHLHLSVLQAKVNSDTKPRASLISTLSSLPYALTHTITGFFLWWQFNNSKMSGFPLRKRTRACAYYIMLQTHTHWRLFFPNCQVLWRYIVCAYSVLVVVRHTWTQTVFVCSEKRQTFFWYTHCTTREWKCKQNFSVSCYLQQPGVSMRWPHPAACSKRDRITARWL